MITDRPDATQLGLQRAFDITVASIACLVFALPAAAIAMAVKLTSRGPVLFVQKRVGRDGELFDVYKFRTMRDGTHSYVLADEVAHQAYRENDFKLPPDDPHITGIGRILRKFSLDEIPQFVNVLAGDMSIVGVRPVEPEQLASWPCDHQAHYVVHRPGMTGLWQINGRSTMLNEDRVQLDRRYLEEWSVWGDIKIAARTPFALLRIHHTH